MFSLSDINTLPHEWAKNPCKSPAPQTIRSSAPRAASVSGGGPGVTNPSRSCRCSSMVIPPGRPRGQFLNQVVNRVIGSGIGLLWPVPLFLFLQACAVPRRTGPGDGGQPSCVAVGTGSLRRSAKVHQQCSAEAPQNRARKAQDRFAGAGGILGLPQLQRWLYGPLLRRKATPSRNRCCSRTSTCGCSPLPSERRCRRRLPGSPLRFPV